MSDLTATGGRRISRATARRQLRRRLVQARAAKYGSHREAAKALAARAAEEGRGWSPRKQDRLEAGEQPLSDRDLPIVFDVFDVPVAEQGTWRVLVDDCQRRGWWDEFGDTELSPNAKAYAQLEWGARGVRCFAGALVPGLLQTDDYAHVLLDAVSIRSPEEHRRFAQAKALRRRVLEPPDPLEYQVIFDESVLHRANPHRDVIGPQIDHIIAVARRCANVTVQVVPFSVGLYAAQASSFTILEFEDGDAVVNVEPGLVASTFTDRFADVSQYSRMWATTRIVAAEPEESLTILEERRQALQTGMGSQ